MSRILVVSLAAFSVTAVALSERTVIAADVTPAIPEAQPAPGSVDDLTAQLGKLSYTEWNADTTAIPAAARLTEALRKLDDDSLANVFGRIPATGWESTGFDLCLTEIVRRGGPHWEESIKARLVAQRVADAKREFLLDRSPQQLLLLTALRRIQKKEDPIAILVEGKAQLTATVASLPRLAVTLTNLDPERVPVGVDVGGDYRGASRHNKWRIEARDANGLLPEIKEFDMGGFSHPCTLEYRESVPMTLDIGSHVAIDRPGEYTLTVLFHPVTRIGLSPTVDGLILCRSIPLKLTVEPIHVELTPAERAKADALILKLPQEGTVRILGGRWSDDMEAFISKTSPAGQLVQMEWKSVPSLIAAVTGDQLKPTQRAWALGLLFSITHQRSPADESGVTGPFEFRGSGRIAFGGTNGGGSMSFDSVTSTGGKIDPEAQMKFAEGWKPWIEKGYLKIDATKEK